MIRLRKLILIFLFGILQPFCFGSDFSFLKLSVENGLSNNLVKAIYKDSFGFIWFGTLEGLDRYDGVEIRPYSSKFPEAVENVFAITEAYKKHLWVGTATGLFRYDNKTDKFDRINIDSANTMFWGFLILLSLTGTFIMIRYIKMLQSKGRRFIEMPLKLEKYKGSKIPESQSKSIIIEMKRYMEDNKPYLNAEFKLGDLASEINYPLHEISQVLNQGLNQNFPDFVNKYRVDEVIKRMKDKAYARFTFFAIAQQCGFNSKTSFYRIFKNETGKTPADFIKELNQS